MRFAILVAWMVVIVCLFWGSRDTAKVVYHAFKITAVLALLIVGMAAFSRPTKLWLLIDAGLVASMFAFWFIVSASTM